MAARAPIKKRALAEFQQSTTITIDPSTSSSSPSSTSPEDSTRLLKRLRLIKKPEEDSSSSTSSSSTTVENEIKNLDASRPAADNFQALSKIVAHLPLSLNPTLSTLLHAKLLNLFSNQEDASIKAKCLTTFQLLSLSITEVMSTIEEILRLIQNETSPLVINSGLTVLLKLGKIANNSASNAKILALATKKLIKHTDSNVKCKCLEIIAFNTPIEPAAQAALQLLHSFSRSHEPRVRTKAFKMMLHLHEKGAKLDVQSYNEVSKYVDDDYESVKLASIQLLWAISQSYSEHPVTSPIGGGEKLRLIDDAFAKICSAINDPCVQVRVLAATLLGQMPQVSQNFLEQTLDKKLMSDMRRKRSAHERQWQKVKSGEWSSGKNWADDAPQELIDADSVSLINSGAAGAFVHGLEDEFLEVRSAAVDSLCTLAIKSSDFANLALDFLVDMFNDEIEDVRLKAVDSLRKLSKHIVLWEDQLETILAALEDSSIDIRESLHKLLSVCHLMTKDCVKMCLDHILDNLKRYPQDKQSIWKCLEGVGRNHPWVVLPLVPQLLSLHPYFDTPEPDPEDSAYVSVLILVFNAAKGCSTMQTLFDEKLLRRYRYLRDTLPHLVPELNITEASSSGSSSNNNVPPSTTSVGASSSSTTTTTTNNAANGRLILKELTQKLKSASNLNNTEMKTKLYKVVLNDLRRLSNVDKEIAAIAKMTSLYIKTQLVYSSILTSPSWSQLKINPHQTSQQNEPIRLQIQTFLQLSLKLQYGFTNLSLKERGIVMQLKLRALALKMVFIVRGSNESALAICQNLLEQAESLKVYLQENEIVPNEFTLSMFKMLDGLEEPKPGSVANLLMMPMMFGGENSIPLVSFSSSIQMAHATIIEPSGESDNALKFTAGLLLGIPVHAELHNVTDTSYIRIMVNYPDQQVHLIYPRASDFRPSAAAAGCGGDVRLITTISVSHQAWTEPCPITVSIVLDLRGPEMNYNRKLMWKKDSAYFIQLSEEKEVLVSPKPSKRGII